jgi:hypothetical protein
MVFVPVGSKYTATAAAKAWIPVSCEHCGRTFGYLASRQAQGAASSILWLDNEGAAERARKAAVKSLDRAFKKARDPVPCPRCVRYQSSMARAVRWRFLRNGMWTGLAVGFAWFLGDLFTWDTTTQTFWEHGTSGVLLVFAAVAAGAILAGVIWAIRFDPDAHAQTHMPPKSSYCDLTPEQFRQISEAGYLVAQG